MSFTDEYHAMSWMANNQIGRRNITETQKSYLLGKLYSSEKKIHGGNRKSETVKSSHQNDDLKNDQTEKPIRNKTASKIARDNNIGETTVCRAEQFSNAIDILSTIIPEIKNEILSGKVKMSRDKLNDLAIVAQSNPEHAKEQYPLFPAKSKL